MRNVSILEEILTVFIIQLIPSYHADDWCFLKVPSINLAHDVNRRRYDSYTREHESIAFSSCCFEISDPCGLSY